MLVRLAACCSVTSADLLFHLVMDHACAVGTSCNAANSNWNYLVATKAISPPMRPTPMKPKSATITNAMSDAIKHPARATAMTMDFPDIGCSPFRWPRRSLPATTQRVLVASYAAGYWPPTCSYRWYRVIDFHDLVASAHTGRRFDADLAFFDPVHTLAGSPRRTSACGQGIFIAAIRPVHDYPAAGTGKIHRLSHERRADSSSVA